MKRADPRLVDILEQRVPRRAARVVADHLQERLARPPPAHAGRVERGTHLVVAAGAHPTRDHRSDDVASFEALALVGEIDPEHRLHVTHRLVAADGVEQALPLAGGDRRDLRLAQ